MYNWDQRKTRDEKTLELSKPIPMILRDWIHHECFYPVNLIGLSWKKKNSVNAIIKHLDGKTEKVEYFRIESLFMDNGDGIQTMHDITGLMAEKEKQIKKFDELISALYTRIPQPDFKKIIEENEKNEN